MANQKQHHYVPRFYLDRFATPSGRVWAFDKSTSSIFCTRPENLARERGFYAAQILRGVCDNVEFLEQAFAALESDAARITSSWIRPINEGRQKIIISEADRNTIAWYIALQSLRTSEQRVILGQLAQSGLSERDLRALHLSTILEDSVVPEITDTIGECIWTFGLNDSGLPFYTSDHPVVARVHPNRRCIHPLQIPTEGLEVMLPLSPTLMLYVYERSYFRSVERFDGHVSPVQFTTELVASDNVCQVGHSKRFVFCNVNAFELARAFCAEHPEVCNVSRNRFTH